MEAACVPSVPVRAEYGNAGDDEESSQPMDTDKEDATPGGDDVRFDDPEAHVEWAKSLPIPQAQVKNPLTPLQTETLAYMVTHPG